MLNFRVNEPYKQRLENKCKGFEQSDKLNFIQTVKKFQDLLKDGDGLKSGVVGVTSSYGSGKSFFLNLLYCRFIREDSIGTVYIDISEYEHEEDLLKVMLVSILKEKKIGRNFIDMAKKLLPSVMKVFAKNVLKIEDEDLKNIAGNLGDVFVERFDEKEALKKEIEKFTNEEPLLIIIDNLDRCEPNFVLYFLSYIKDLFGLANVLFVLAYDKRELTNAIKSRYGEKVDVESYIRKYIGAEFELYRKGDIKTIISEYLDAIPDKYKEYKGNYENVINALYNRGLTLRKVELLSKRFVNIINKIKDEDADIKKFAGIFMLLYLKFCEKNINLMNYEDEKTRNSDIEKTEKEIIENLTEDDNSEVVLENDDIENVLSTVELVL